MRSTLTVALVKAWLLAVGGTTVGRVRPGVARLELPAVRLRGGGADFDIDSMVAAAQDPEAAVRQTLAETVGGASDRGASSVGLIGTVPVEFMNCITNEFMSKNFVS